VAFVSHRGLALIEPSLESAVRRGSRLEFVIGLDGRATRPEALSALFEMARGSDRMSLFCYASLPSGGIYHPKLYIFRTAQEFRAIIGSSNLTEGGLRSNVEANVLIECNVGDEISSDLYSTYMLLKYEAGRFEPDAELVSLYARFWESEKEHRTAASREPRARSLTMALEEKAKSLRRPCPARCDLMGWLGLVYDALPEGEFTNEDVYQREKEFRRHYPENHTIQAKIRQQLQTLRDMGLLEHVTAGLWRKVPGIGLL